MPDQTGGTPTDGDNSELAAFERSLPLSLDQLKGLLRQLNRSNAPECDHTLREAMEFARANGISESALRSWLEDFGGHCDCEVIYNVYDAVGDHVGWCLDA